MIAYFYMSKNKDKKGEERPAQPWIANWNREQLVERMRAEIDGHMGMVKDGRNKRKIERNKEKRKERKNKKNKKKKASSSSSESDTSETEIYSSSESETEEDSEEPKRKQPT
ncbi:hypothetical protein Ahy_A09g045627 [Arachis hypogaea]|uniref:Uncharacterized protein n=1 Tax=Arachis hypogaea TaxID=3818 RepID=A0A445BMR4_ARAHY|nr:hypothetical protein Ahy_A09g045627 [Arachis hypogaea]